MNEDEILALIDRRSKIGRRRVTALAVIGLFVMIVLSVVLQRQINAHSAYVHRQCVPAQHRAIKTNANWEALAVIERRNKFIDDDIRQARLDVFDNAKLKIPTC